MLGRGPKRPHLLHMRCRFCDTDIADKAIICYRCGKPTTDARVAPAAIRGSGPSGAVAAVVAVASGAAAVYLPDVADGTVLYAAWAGVTAVAAATAGAWWRGRR